jgi:hypothetical protein
MIDGQEIGELVVIVCYPSAISSTLIVFQIKGENGYNPHVLNTTVDGRQGYATSDLIVRHPTESDRYCIYGRVDDQLALSTGEKVTLVDNQMRHI